MPRIILYYSPTTCSHVTLSALYEAGADFEAQLINLPAGQQKSSDYLAINPKGKVPALSVDGEVLTENPAILALLNDIFPSANLLPAMGSGLRGYIGLSDLIWCSNTLHPMTRQISMPGRWTKGDIDGVRADGIEKFDGECAALSARLSDSPWWHGDQWSIVDTYLYWLCATARNGGFPLDRYPALLAHAERIRSRPSFDRVRNHEFSAARSIGIDLEASHVLRLS